VCISVCVCVGVRERERERERERVGCVLESSFMCVLACPYINSPGYRIGERLHACAPALHLGPELG
jgi:hypothetical protein